MGCDNLRNACDGIAITIPFMKYMFVVSERVYYERNLERLLGQNSDFLPTTFYYEFQADKWQWVDRRKCLDNDADKISRHVGVHVDGRQFKIC